MSGASGTVDRDRGAADVGRLVGGQVGHGGRHLAGSIKRPVGETERAKRERSASFGISNPRKNGVSTEAGQTAFTLTPVLASSIAIDFVSMITPPFDAQ